MSCVDENGSFEVTWSIENFSFCMFDDDISLGSPIFKTETAGGNSYSWWKLYLENKNSSIPSLAFKLEKVKGDSDVSKCEMSLSSGFEVMELTQEDRNFCCFTIQKVAIFNQNIHLVPKDTMIVNCKIWHEMIKPGRHSFGSVLQRGYAFFQMTNNLNTLIYDQDNLQLTSTIYSNERCITLEYKYKHLVEILPSRNGWHSFVKSKLTRPLDPSCKPMAPQGHLICGTRVWDISVQYLTYQLKLEFIVAVATVSLEKEDTQLSPDPTAVSSELVPVSFKTLKDDLLLLYNDKLLSDATLNTKGKSFSAHKSILAARSSVFRAMFDKDQMSEIRSGIVDIEDIDGETVDRMLVFLYGDSLEKLQWEEASALYYAADKYAIHPLKQRCADILKAGLAVDNACDAFVLADKHSDEQLMKGVVDFIRNHQEVFLSSEWGKLEVENPSLTIKIFREVYVRKRRA